MPNTKAAGKKTTRKRQGRAPAPLEEEAATGAESAAAAETPDPKARKKSKAELVSEVMEKVVETISSQGVKPSVGDFIRLLQLEEEMSEEPVREIEVRWVDPEEQEEGGDR